MLNTVYNRLRPRKPEPKPQPNPAPARRGLQHLPSELKECIIDFCDVDQHLALARVDSAFRGIVTPKLLLQPPSLVLWYDLPRHSGLELLFDPILWGPAGLKVMAFNWECGGHIPQVDSLKKSLINYSSPLPWPYRYEEDNRCTLKFNPARRNQIGWVYDSELPARVFGLAFYFAAGKKDGVKPFSMSSLLEQPVADDDDHHKRREHKKRTVVKDIVIESGSLQARRVLEKLYKNKELSFLLVPSLGAENPLKSMRKMLPDWENILGKALQEINFKNKCFLASAEGLCPHKSFKLLLDCSRPENIFESSSEMLERGYSLTSGFNLFYDFPYPGSIDSDDDFYGVHDYRNCLNTGAFFNHLFENEALDLDAFGRILTLGWTAPRDIRALISWLFEYETDPNNEAELVSGWRDPYLDLARTFVSEHLEQQRMWKTSPVKMWTAEMMYFIGDIFELRLKSFVDGRWMFPRRR